MSVTLFKPDGSSLTLDLTLREDYRPEVLVTDHPIEDGAVASDHAQRMPLLVTLEGNVTESPYALRVTSARSALSGSPSGATDNLSGPARIQAAIDWLRSAERERLTLVSLRFGAFRDLMLMRWPHSVDLLLRLPLVLELKQLRVATSQAVALSPLTPRVEVQAQTPDEQDMGEQGAVVDEGPNRDRDRSVLLRGLQSLGLAG